MFQQVQQSNNAQKEQELQLRHHEQILHQQQKLQELQGQIQAAQYAASGAVGPPGLMFLPLLEQLRSIQPAALPPGVAKSPLGNHVSKNLLSIYNELL